MRIGIMPRMPYGLPKKQERKYSQAGNWPFFSKRRVLNMLFPSIKEAPEDSGILQLRLYMQIIRQYTLTAMRFSMAESQWATWSNLRMDIRLIAPNTNVFGDIAEWYESEPALLPIGDAYTMSPREAAKAVRLLKTKHVIPTHFGIFDFLTGRPSELSALLSDIEDLTVYDIILDILLNGCKQRFVLFLWKLDGHESELGSCLFIFTLL